VCVITFDGYYVVIALCFLFGLALVPVLRAKLLPLQTFDLHRANLESKDALTLDALV